jgi:S1-C subfamily serine protease
MQDIRDIDHGDIDHGAVDHGDIDHGDIDHGTRPGGGAPGRAYRRWSKIAALTAAAALIAGAGFGVFAAAGGLDRAAPPPSAAIPHPPKANATFVEDDNGAGQDSQQNILARVAPGLVQVVTSGTIRAGLVITPSGKVLTSDDGLAGRMTVRFVMAGAVFTARLIGADPAAGLALLQIEGGHGRPFPVVRIGNSADFLASSARSKLALWHPGTDFAVTAVGTSGVGATLDTGTLTSLSGRAVVGGQALGGLLQTTAQVLPGQETGGPLVDLSGEVIGIDVAGSGTSPHYVGYAIPVNAALAIARQVNRHR